MATATLTHPVAARIEHVRVTAHEVPMEVPESDATLEWSSTTSACRMCRRRRR